MNAQQRRVYRRAHLRECSRLDRERAACVLTYKEDMAWRATIAPTKRRSRGAGPAHLGAWRARMHMSQARIDDRMHRRINAHRERARAALQALLDKLRIKRGAA